MYDAELMAVATGAAGTLVASIATWGAEEARAKVAHFFRLADSDQQDDAARAVNETAASLRQPDAGAHAAAVSVWIRLIARYLADHREAVTEIDELVALGPSVSKVWNQHNTGTGTFIGGDVHGGMTLNHGGASHDRR
jgi:hypothetical protein